MENDDAMEVRGGSSSDVWATRNEKIFIQPMDEEVKSKKSREISTFTVESWKRIRSELKKLTRYPYTKEQLKNKYNALRALFNNFNSLKANTSVGWDSTLLTITAPDDSTKANTGVGWDSTLLTITALDDVWARLFKVNKQARSLKKRGMPYYHELCHIFGDTSATGVHAHPSNKAPSSTNSSDPEFQFKDEPEVESERRVDVLEKQLHGSLPGYSGVSGSASIGEMGLGPLAAGMAQCQALLNTMEDLDEDSYNKVLEKLHDDVLWRQIFMDMLEQRRLAWIKRL
ncbi:hypothetical protein Vadar_006759 [Vaccinium darrowii]|uniref:Uncharacterized protein n=1 Tax=Vaccinium darrowii TaxID=229202 RepID=A0ACB7WYJ2_9ERIC|nr:hypothetical protein Vadar_006759 [Vaccinium darrowii]